MSSTTIQFALTVDGAAVDADALPVLSDPTAAFGVRRTDTMAIVLAAGTAFVRDGLGLYSKTFTDPAAGLTYNYWVKAIVGGQVITFERNQSGAGAATAGAYATLSEGDAIAAALPLLVKYKAASSELRAAALILASDDIDAAGPWQGRKYGPCFNGGSDYVPQVREFPRVPYPEDFSLSAAGAAGPWGLVGQLGGAVWDWDFVNKVAVVPAKVKQACVWQADAICDGRLAKALDDRLLGVQSKSVGSLSIAYRDPLAVLAYLGGGLGTLAVRAEGLMKQYRLRQGRLL